MKNFTRTIENFTCDVCKTVVTGNGYTNHCPHCLSSKHVDINPGDRACSCHGIMYASALEVKNGQQYIIHTCCKCGHVRRNKVCADDNFKAVLALSNGTLKSFIEKIKGAPKS